MEVYEAIQKRRSIRKYEKKKIDKNIIGLLLEAAINAPCAGNVQEWRFIIVEDEKQKEKIAKACYDQLWMKDASCYIVICADLDEIESFYGERGKKMYAYLDCAHAAQNILLQATELKLGTCVVAAFDDEKIKQILELPENVIPIEIITVGYPAEQPEKPERKSLSSITFYEKYGKKLE